MRDYDPRGFTWIEANDADRGGHDAPPGGPGPRSEQVTRRPFGSLSASFCLHIASARLKSGFRAKRKRAQSAAWSEL